MWVVFNRSMMRQWLRLAQYEWQRKGTKGHRSKFLTRLRRFPPESTGAAACCLCNSLWFGPPCLRPLFLFFFVLGLFVLPLSFLTCSLLSSLMCWSFCRFSSCPCMPVFGGRRKARCSFPWLWLSLVFIACFYMVCFHVFFIFFGRKVLVNWLRHVPAVKYVVFIYRERQNKEAN